MQTTDRPSLGNSASEIYRAWQAYTPPMSALRVVGIVYGYGVFDWDQNNIRRLHESDKSGCAWYEWASRQDLDEIDSAINNGAFQVELRPVSGVMRGQGGQGSIAASAYKPIVLHQATGRPLYKCNNTP